MAPGNLTIERVKDFFSNASMYEKLVGETTARLAADALSHLPLSTYTSTSRILDSACGPGIVTRLLLSPCPATISAPGLPINPPPQVTGVDISEQMIELYKTNASTLGWTTTETFVQNAQDLSRFPDATFDAVVISLALFAFPDAVAGAKEMYRVLKPGGHAVVTTWKVTRPHTLMTSVAESIHPGGAVMDIEPKWYTSEHLASVMKDGGFKAENVQLSESTPNWNHASLDDLMEAFQAPMWKGQYCKGWSEEETAKWLKEVTNQLTTKEKESATLEMVAHVCVAQKEH
ncbi:S-adenosyl-L-methionine-dependent methyltransferase [Xylaria sp. FL1777]|nr:S-adenosyl-L-methionine-dependent methyltransferase [Xylaria sp. FL1777]